MEFKLREESAPGYVQLEYLKLESGEEVNLVYTGLFVLQSAQHSLLSSLIPSRRREQQEVADVMGRIESEVAFPLSSSLDIRKPLELYEGEADIAYQGLCKRSRMSGVHYAVIDQQIKACELKKQIITGHTAEQSGWSEHNPEYTFIR